MITTVPFNEYSCGDLIGLLQKYNIKGHRIKPFIVSKPHEDFSEEGFMLSFEVCELTFEDEEQESMFLLRLSSEEINKYIDKTSLEEMGFDYAKKNN